MGYFDHIPNIKYEGASSQNPFAFHYYDADALIAGNRIIMDMNIPPFTIGI